MNGGKKCEGGVVEGQTAPVQVPMGWQRRVDPSGVHYISPSGSVLSSLDQVKTYLLTDGTCKCGLECPLTLPKVFNFDPGAAVKQRTADDVRADEDVTKLCIHKRKLLAVATLHKSMETHPSLALTSPGGGVKAMAPARFTAQRAIRNKPYETALPNSVVPDCKNPFRMMMMAAGQQQHHHHHHHQQQQQQRHHYPPELGGTQMQQELYPGYPRQQQQRMSNSSEPGPRSPYRGDYGAMLSPPPSSSSSSHLFLYGDGGSLSPRTDPMGSPLGHHNPPSSSSCSFPGGAAATSPGGRTPLSPPGMLLLHSSSPGATAQLSCAVMAAAGRTSTPLSPTATAKSPVMTSKARGGAGFAPPPMNAAAFHHKTPPHPHPAPSPGAPPPCALQRKQTSSEKDPLGILDPILSKPPPSSSSSNPPGYQPSGVLLSQVPVMNVTIPPAIVPLPSNLPLPTVKPGGHVHVQRTQQAAALSPSPVTSPGHGGAGPGPPLGGGGRTEASPHRSRSSSTSSDHGGSFAVPQAAAGGGGVGGVKAPPHPRSPRSVVGSPRPAMPSSPSSSNARPSDALHLHHQYKDAPGQLLSGMSGGGAQHNPMYPPPPTTGGTGAGGPPQAMQGHPGLLAMPLNQILSKQNAASFPASSLLSAAAKAQLANQNKQSANNNNNNGGGMSVGGGAGSGHPGPLVGARSVEAGHGTLNPMLPPNSAVLLAAPEGGGAIQSGRAALRDKLMAQQRERDPLRKRKQPGNSGAASANHDSVILNMLGGKPGMMGNGGPSSRSPLAAAEQLRKAGRLGGGLPPNASMAQLLQSMSGQNSHMSAGNHRLQSSHPARPGPMHYPGDGPMAHQGAAQQRLLHGQAGEGLHCQRTDPGPHGQFPGMMMTQMQAGPLAGCGPLSSGGLPDGLPLGHHSHNNTNPPPPPLSHAGQPQHPHSQNHLHVGTLGRSGLSGMALNGNDRSCGQALSESGDPSSLSCGVSNPQLGVLQAHHHNHHHLHPHHHHHHGGGNGGQMYPQHSQGQQQQQQQHLHHHPGFQGAQAYPDLPLQDNGSSGSMACLYQNYQQVCLPENVPLTQMSSQAGMTSLPETQGGMLSHPQFGEGMPGTDRLPGGGGGGTESVDAIYRAVVDAASKGMHVVITATVSGVTQSGPAPSLSAMSAFGGGSGVREGGPVGLPHHAAVQHARPTRQARPGRPQKTPEHGTGGAADAPEAHDYFRSPQGGGQWDGSSVGGEVHGGLDGHGGPWGGGGGSGEEFLECSTQVRSGPCVVAPALPPSCPPEAPHDHGLLPAAASDKGGFLEDAFRFGNNCVRMPLNYKERLEQTVERCAQMNGGLQFSTVGRGGGGYGVDVLGPPRHELTGDDQSPGSSTSLEGPLPPVAREYAHYGNGHFNGHCAPSPSDTKSLSSEEELRHPDSPSSSSSELLHYRPARGSFHVGELVWGGQLKGFPPWPAKLAGEEQQLHHHHHHHHHHHGAGGPLRDQGKVEAEKRKTLTHDLEALDRATKRSRKSGKLNNHLEAAIHEAMSELDKMSGTVHQLPSRDRQAKVPKPKRRKISR